MNVMPVSWCVQQKKEKQENYLEEKDVIDINDRNLHSLKGECSTNLKSCVRDIIGMIQCGKGDA
jgi:hypothetical protein